MLSKTVEEFVQTQKGALVVAEFQRLNNNVNYYENELKVQKGLVAKALVIVEKKRESLRKALEERQIQEKLKEKAYDIFVEEEKLKEQKKYWMKL